MTFVLDSSAILAALWNEPGADRVAEVVEGAIISSVCASEIMAKLLERGADEEQARRTVDALPVLVRDFDLECATGTAALRPLTRHRGLSLGDRACLALAKRENATVLTADRAWSGLELGISVEVIR